MTITNSALVRGFEAHIENRPYQDSIGIYLVKHGEGASNYVLPTVLTIQTRNHDLSAMIHEPSLELPRDMVAQIMTGLWRIGIRPVGVTDDSDKVELLKAHVADLREQLKNSTTIIRELNSIIADRPHG